jgi:thiamine biosynthesis lipoprotein
MSRFSPTSDVGRANTSAAGDAVEVTVPTARVLGEAIRWAEASDGRFDPCLGRATALWNFEERPRLPDARQIERVAGERAYRELEIGRSGARHTVRLRSDQVAIDLGGIAKGYGVDRAIAALRKGGISNGLVNAGGDLYALGRSEQGNEWTIGVRDPARPATLAATLKMSDRGVATSGDYFQYFDHEGRRYHHLLDPATGGPRETRMHSVTVAAATCMAADAAATTVFGLGPDVGQKLLRRTEPGARIVHSA